MDLRRIIQTTEYVAKNWQEENYRLRLPISIYVLIFVSFSGKVEKHDEGRANFGEKI